ncbi:MAG: hypothetical protein WCT77_05540 [Bacteroidota bacterium]
MSKGGGAGKVYFVLYLAVVLELLIIIVERDEAEEGLLKKQRETMKIVESILSQLQAGAGTEGINTRPQDEITIPPAGANLKEVMGADIKSFRKYIVEVGVTDIINEIKRKEGESDNEYYNNRLKKLVKLASVEEIEYQIFFSSSQDPNNAPLFPDEDEIRTKGYEFGKFKEAQTIPTPDGTGTWEFLALRKLVLDEDATYNQIDLKTISPEKIIPIYPLNKRFGIGQAYAPPGIKNPEDSVFYYSHEKTLLHATKSGSGGLKKRAFEVNFQPPSRAGWYKLRFHSRTNRILGVSAEKTMETLSDETTVNIGTVQLTVRDLQKVKKELMGKLDKYDLPKIEDLARTGDVDKFDEKLKQSIEIARKGEDATEMVGKVELFGYIAKLLTPGQSVNFSQNKGSIEFNVRVVTPHPQIAELVVNAPSYVPSFDKIPAVFDFSISPYQGEGVNQVEGKVIDVNGNTVAKIDCRPVDKVSSSAPQPQRGGRRDYYGHVDQTLPPGKYKVDISHRTSGKTTTQQLDLEIFPTGLTEESESNLKTYLNIQARYGSAIFINNAVPSSGGKIKSNQFRTYLSTDVDQQRAAVENYQVTRDQAVKLTPNANTLKCRITWIQPITGNEVDLFPEQSYTIKQRNPRVSQENKNISVTGQEKKLSIRISGIIITGSSMGDDAMTNSQVEVRLGTSDVKVADYQLAGDPRIEKTEGDKYTIYLDITGKLPRGETSARGTISVQVIAKAKNTLNGKDSDDERKVVSANINYEPERQSRVPQGGGRKPR